MSEEMNKNAETQTREYVLETDLPAYMNRNFCSTKERVTYILKTATAELNLGKYDTTSELYLYKIFGLNAEAHGNAAVTLGIYDLINDPLSAVIIDKMRTRWGKFKPFQYLALIPSILVGITTCVMPLIADAQGMNAAQRLIFYMIISYVSETVNAFFGGGGYIDNVFTPNPNERTALLVSSRFASDLFRRFPEQLAGVLFDLVANGKININLTKVFAGMKSFWWVIATVPAVMWVFVSKERVPQSEKPPRIVKGMFSVFKNKPLLIYTLSGFVDGINVGTSQSLYYDSVLKFNMMSTIAGIPGMPISYASYPWATRFRKRFSTKTLWLFQRGSIITSELGFFLVGLIGGKKNGFYKKKLPMTIAMMLGNSLEMVFYGTKKIIENEINYEVLDYCEWQNGYRVEATVNLLTGYINKVRGIALTKINTMLLARWAGFESGLTAVQSEDTMWKMFIAAFGPQLIFDFLSLVPMFFYNIDQKTRDRMYLDLERTRAATAAKEKKSFVTEE
ncbi:MAG: MFS transporter [Clostridia bacterium]|nr:MFS transporter [Clostridia bacterium]